MMAEKEVILPVPESTALTHIEITILRQIGDNIAGQTRSLEKLSDQVQDVRERVIRIEAEKTEHQISALRSELSAAIGRIDRLEAAHDRAAGAVSFGAWLTQSAPWLVAAAASVLAVVGWQQRH